jgi:lipoprotein signal peptidase
MPAPLIYFLQSMICIILLGCILFMKKWYYILPLALAFTGGMFNLFDRVVGFPGDPNTVIDYIPTLWLNNTTSNFPDFSIVGGVIAFAVLYVIFTIIDAFAKNKQAEGDQHGKDPSPKP